MFEKLLKVVTKSAPGNDNDFADRLNYRYTAAVYMLMSMAVIGRSYIADPIKCWTPSFFPEPWVDYTNNLCFVQSTYYIPMDIPLDADGAEEIKRDNEITYYQWIPLFFMMLAMCFYVPRAVWFNVFSHHFVDINAIVDLLTSFDNAVNPETRDPAVMQVAKHIDRYLTSTAEYRTHPIFKLRSHLAKKKVFLFYCGRRYGLSITTIYLQLKLCYIFIGVMQIYWIDTFLMGATESSVISYYKNIFTESYAIKVLTSLAHDNSSLELSPKFPRITMCEFEVRSVGELLVYNVQCVLPLNLFNEKIFLFLWMWIAFVLIMTCTNMMAWLWRLGISWNREHYMMKHLKLTGKLSEENMRHHRKITKKLMRYFIHDYLRPDGVFLMRLIAINTNCLISAEIIASLWENFLDHPFIAKRAEDYHNQLKDLGLLTEDDDNQVLASLKAMNLKASATTLGSNQGDTLPNLRIKNENFSIFEPLIPKKSFELLDLPKPKPTAAVQQTAASKRFTAKFAGRRESSIDPEQQPVVTHSRRNAFESLGETMDEDEYQGLKARKGRGEVKGQGGPSNKRFKALKDLKSRAKLGFGRSSSCDNGERNRASDIVIDRPETGNTPYSDRGQRPQLQGLNPEQPSQGFYPGLASPRQGGFFPRPIFMGPLQSMQASSIANQYNGNESGRNGSDGVTRVEVAPPPYSTFAELKKDSGDN